MAEIELGPRMLRVLAWICWVLAAAMALSVALTLVTGPPPWNRIDKLGDAAAWWYVGALHMTLARRTPPEPDERLRLQAEGATIIEAATYADLAQAERAFVEVNRSHNIEWLGGGTGHGQVWTAYRLTEVRR